MLRWTGWVALTCLLQAAPGTKPDAYRGRAVVSGALHEEFWLTSRRGAYSAVEAIVVTLHVRNMGEAPARVRCGSEDFTVRLEDERGREVPRIRRAEVPEMRFAKVLGRGEESGDCMRVAVDDKMHPEDVLPTAGVYVVDVSPKSDAGLHVRLRFGYAAE